MISVISLIILLIGSIWFARLAAIDRFFEYMMCDTEVKGVHPSPGNEWAVVEFQKLCGATTGFNTQISLIPREAEFDEKKFQPFFLLDDHRSVKIKWTDNNLLLVELPSEPGRSKLGQPDNIIVRYK